MFAVMFQEMKISISININRIIFTIKKLPLIGGRISDEWYARLDIKKILSVLAVIKGIISKFFVKSLYYVGVSFLPLIVIMGGMEIDIKNISYINMWIFFWISCMGGTLFNNATMSEPENDNMFIYQLRVDPKKHYLSKIFTSHIESIVYYAIIMLVALSCIGSLPVYKTLMFICIYGAFRFIGEGIKLWLSSVANIGYEDAKKIPKIIYCIYLVCVVLVAYLPYLVICILNGNQSFTAPKYMDVLLNGVSLFIVAVVTVLSIRYIVNYNEYKKIGQKYAGYAIIASREKAVEELLNEDTKNQVEDITDEEIKRRDFCNRSGYEYLNALFFERHKNLFKKSIRRKVFGTAIIFGSTAICLVFANILCSGAEFKELSDEVWDSINRMITILVFIMYCVSSGKKMTRAMFYNCDYSLLKYGYYRTPNAILTNFRIRLGYMIRKELPMVGVMCVGIVVDAILLHKADRWIDIISLMICICSLAIFFSIVYLCMYYIFQPYTEGGAETGIGYKVCAGVIYIVSYSCLQIQTVPSFFAWLVTGVTVVGLFVGYIIAYKLAPKHFVLK